MCMYVSLYVPVRPTILNESLDFRLLVYQVRHAWPHLYHELPDMRGSTGGMGGISGMSNAHGPRGGPGPGRGYVCGYRGRF
jgi:hypothetical protein